MPTYAYKCTACQNKLEALQKMSDPCLTKCPACNQQALKRVPALIAGIALNGSGYYETDYKTCCPCETNNCKA